MNNKEYEEMRENVFQQVKARYLESPELLSDPEKAVLATLATTRYLDKVKHIEVMEHVFSWVLEEYGPGVDDSLETAKIVMRSLYPLIPKNGFEDTFDAETQMLSTMHMRADEAQKLLDGIENGTSKDREGDLMKIFGGPDVEGLVDFFQAEWARQWRAFENCCILADRVDAILHKVTEIEEQDYLKRKKYAESIDRTQPFRS